MVTLIIICVLLFICLCITTIGMLKGMKKTEEYERVFADIKNKANNAYIQIKEVDTLGAFEADDDVGITFTEILNIVEELNNYVIANIEEEMNG